MEFLKRIFGPRASRRTALKTALGMMATFALFKSFREAPKRDTVKLLTRDGKLVEVDRMSLPKTNRLARTDEIKDWIVNNNPK